MDTANPHFVTACNLHADENDADVADPKATSGHAYLVVDFDSLLFLASLHQQRGAYFTEDLAQACRYTRAQADSAREQLIQPCVVVEIEESKSVCMLTAAEADVARAAFSRLDSGRLA